MQKFIAILRGINVGGHRKIKMADLKLMLEKMGLTNVETYIQSGNLAFSSDKIPEDIETQMEKSINKSFGFDVPVIVRNKDEVKDIINSNPYLETSDINNLFVTFLSSKPTADDVLELEKFNAGDDEFQLAGKNIFMKCTGPYHKSKLTNVLFEKTLKVKATSRNWKTCLKLFEMANK